MPNSDRSAGNHSVGGTTRSVTYEEDDQSKNSTSQCRECDLGCLIVKSLSQKSSCRGERRAGSTAEMKEMQRAATAVKGVASPGSRQRI